MTGQEGDGRESDQSIETVLQSIRRAMKDGTPPEASHVDKTGDEELLLDHSMLVAQGSGSLGDVDRSLLAIAAREQEKTSEIFGAEQKVSTASEERAPETSDLPDEGLIGQQTMAAAERSLDALHDALSRHERRTTISGNTQVSTGSLTIEEMVRQEVRGMVRTWLDAHLPSLVEIMVRGEIAKMTRR